MFFKLVTTLSKTNYILFSEQNEDFTHLFYDAWFQNWQNKTKRETIQNVDDSVFIYIFFVYVSQNTMAGIVLFK